MNEASYTNKLKRALESEGALFIKYKPGNGQRVGVPDAYVAHPEWVGWIEFKMGRRPVTPVQRSVCEMLLSRGVPVVVLRGPDHSLEDTNGNQIGEIDWGFPIIPQLHAIGVLPTTQESKP